MFQWEVALPGKVEWRFLVFNYLFPGWWDGRYLLFSSLFFSEIFIMISFIILKTAFLSLKKLNPDGRVKSRLKEWGGEGSCNSIHPGRWLSDLSSKNELESVNIAEPI